MWTACKRGKGNASPPEPSAEQFWKRCAQIGNGILARLSHDKRENEKDKEKTKNIYTPHDNINSINNNLNITTPIDRNTEKKPKGDPKSYEDRN